MVRAKYQAVLELGEKLNIQDGDVKEENGVLHVTGTAANQYEKNQLWDAIKAAGGENPADIMADIKVADESIYARHTVASGESLSKIAKHYYKDPMKYNAIFEANRNILNNPDMIHPGQELVIPNL
ncbi:MAG: LysM peptidoglycan-binding domain-containing protein [Bacteroidota bacterium]